MAGAHISGHCGEATDGWSSKAAQALVKRPSFANVVAGASRWDETSSSPSGLVLRRWVSVFRDWCRPPAEPDVDSEAKKSSQALGPDDQPRHIERRANDGRRPPGPLW